MSKICIHCGAELSEEASFCPHCATEQTEKQAVKMPKLWRKKLLITIAALAFLAVVALVIAGYHRPVVYEGGAEIIYPTGAGNYHVLVTFSATDGVMKTGEAEVAIELPEGMESAFPDQLYIFREDTDALVWEDFMELVESCEVEITPRDGARRMSNTMLGYDESFPYAALKTDIIYDTTCGTNDILWTLKMKNGDKILLKQTIAVSVQNAVSYYPEDVPMDTAEDLQALLDQVESEVDPDTVVNLYLPPVVYDREIHVGKGCYAFYGGSDGVNRTTFTKTITVQTGVSLFLEMYGIRFEGEGGTGLVADDCVLVYDCVFTGWDVGAIARNGAWVAAYECTFEDNGVGLQMDTQDSPSSDHNYRNNRFVGNGTGLLISNLYGTQILSFPGCVFADNETDILNGVDHPLDLSGAVFE